MKKIIILMMVLVVSLFAGNDKEIGVPYVERGQGSIQSAVLDPDGEHFYTLKDEIISKWQLSPIKKINSFIPKFKSSKNAKQKNKDNLYRDIYHMDITDDSKKMIFRNTYDIFIWDLENNRLMKRIEKRTKWGIIDNSTYKTLNINSKYEIDYTEWDIESLKIIKSTVEHAIYTPMYFSINSNVLTMFANNYVIFLDKNNLSVKLSVHVDNNKLCFSNIKQTNLYCNGNENINMSNGIVEKYKKNDIGKKYYYGYSHRMASSVKQLSLIPKDLLIQISKESKAPYTFYNNKNDKKIAEFYLFENFEWMLKKGRYFQASSNAKQYLKMRTTSRKIVPINNETYNKYNKKINLNAN